MSFLERLCETYGPSGREEKVRRLIRSEVKKYADSVKTDALGNLICRIAPARGRSKATRIMFCAHMDEIGLIVTHIDKKGFLRFTGVGAPLMETILYKNVVFENGRVGIIGAETKSATPRPPRTEHLFIDIGAQSKADALAAVKIGDIASFHQRAFAAGRRLTCKALDDRIGCYCLVETMKKIKANRDDLYFVFTVQEEVGLRGAKTSAFGIAPRYALAVDVTRTGDTPESAVMEVGLGNGAAVKVKDSYFLPNPAVRDRLIRAAKKCRVPYQLEVLENGTTDAAVVQLIREGVSSGVLSIPTRYVHTISETCDLFDVDCAITILTEIGNYGIE